MDLLIPALLCGLCLPLAGHAVILPWLRSQRSTVARARHARHNPTPATLREIAENEAALEPGLSGNTIQLPCRECGRCAIPPVEYVDSPRIPVELTTLVEETVDDELQWRIVATCTRCYGPLISRVLDAELADHAVSIGVFDPVTATP